LNKFNWYDICGIKICPLKYIGLIYLCDSVKCCKYCKVEKCSGRCNALSCYFPSKYSELEKVEEEIKPDTGYLTFLTKLVEVKRNGS